MWARALALVLTLAAGAGAAQETVPSAPVLVIEFDRILSGSRAGQRLRADLDATREALVAENERIQDELTVEERALTERRATLAPEEFRALAEAFDARVTALRAAQDEKARTLTQEAEQRQQAFLQRVGPVLEQIMSEAGADLLIERGQAVMVQDAVIITDLAIQRIDALLGDGRP